MGGRSVHPDVPTPLTAVEHSQRPARPKGVPRCHPTAKSLTSDVNDGPRRPTASWHAGAVNDHPAPPAGYHSVTPRIVTPDLDAQVELLRTVFGATGDVEPGRPAELRIGDSLVMVSQAGERDVFPAFLYVYVGDVQATYERALAAGATTMEAPLDTPYGDRRAMVRDPFGNVFQIASRLEP